MTKYLFPFSEEDLYRGEEELSAMSHKPRQTSDSESKCSQFLLCLYILKLMQKYLNNIPA